MKILHTSDWHLGRMLENFTRLDEQKEFVDFICQTADEEKIDLVIIAGDIFDTYNPSAKAEELFYSAVSRLNANGKRAVIVIAGNHDNPDRLCAASSLTYKNGIILLGYPKTDASEYEIESEDISIVDAGPGWLEISIASCSHNAVVLTLPYPSEARLREVLTETAQEDELQRAFSERIGELLEKLAQKFREDTINIIAGHLFILGGKESESERTLQVGGALTVNASVLPDSADYIALGHLHRPQRIKSAASPTYYSGSPLAYSFSESDYAKSLFVVDIAKDKNLEVSERIIPCKKPLKSWRAKSIEEAMAWCVEGKDATAWIDLEITMERVLTTEEYRIIRQAHGGIINIRPKLQRENVEEAFQISREGKKIDELFSMYYRSKEGVEIDEKLLATLLEVLNDSEDDYTNDFFDEVAVSDNQSGGDV